MKKITKYMLGIVSSLLLAGGLARAAEMLDPLSQNNASTALTKAIAAPDCVNEPCALIEDGN